MGIGKRAERSHLPHIIVVTAFVVLSGSFQNGEAWGVVRLWEGDWSNKWELANNWNPTGVPAGGDIARVENGATSISGQRGRRSLR
jgi:hypothetical protein